MAPTSSLVQRRAPLRKRFKRARLSAVVSRRHVIVRNDGPRVATDLIVVDADAPGAGLVRELERLPKLAPGDNWTVELPEDRKGDVRILLYWHDPRGAQQLQASRKGAD